MIEVRALVTMPDDQKPKAPPTYMYIKISGNSFSDIEREAKYVENELQLKFDNNLIRVIVFTKYPGGTEPLD